MTTSKQPHPPGALVPKVLILKDWVFLNGPNVGIYSGVMRVQFKGLEGAEGFYIALQRNSKDQIFFQVPPPLDGRYEVVGVFDKDSPIPEHQRSFGETQISPS